MNQQSLMNQSFPHIKVKIREGRNKKGKSRNEELEGVKDGDVHNVGSGDKQIKLHVISKCKKAC